MADTTTKEQVIEGTLKGMDDIYQPTPGSAFIYHELKEYVRRRLDSAYELGYHHGETNERKMEQDKEFAVGDRVLYKKNGVLMEGTIKSIAGDVIEIDDFTIKVRKVHDI